MLSIYAWPFWSTLARISFACALLSRTLPRNRFTNAPPTALTAPITPPSRTSSAPAPAPSSIACNTAILSFSNLYLKVSGSIGTYVNMFSMFSKSSWTTWSWPSCIAFAAFAAAAFSSDVIFLKSRGLVVISMPYIWSCSSRRSMCLLNISFWVSCAGSYCANILALISYSLIALIARTYNGLSVFSRVPCCKHNLIALAASSKPNAVFLVAPNSIIWSILHFISPALCANLCSYLYL